MYQTPLFDDGSHFARQASLAHLARGDIHQCLKTLVFSVDVGRRMIVMPHADDDSEEDGKCWHGEVIFLE